MSKILLALLFVLGIAAIVYAAPKRVPTVVTSGGDGLVASGKVTVKDANAYWNGVVAGSSLVLRNSTTIGGDAVFTVVADTTAGSKQMSHLQRDILVDVGLYAHITAATGTFGVELFYE
jgi:hypothetical protein